MRTHPLVNGRKWRNPHKTRSASISPCFSLWTLIGQTLSFRLFYYYFLFHLWWVFLPLWQSLVSAQLPRGPSVKRVIDETTRPWPTVCCQWDDGRIQGLCIMIDREPSSQAALPVYWLVASLVSWEGLSLGHPSYRFSPVLDRQGKLPG